MRHENVLALPPRAFAAGLGRLEHRSPAKNVVVLGFDTEYDAITQEIISYQLSDGEVSLVDRDPYDIPLVDFTHSCLLERTTDLSWAELSEWVVGCLKDWGYQVRDIDTILLVSHFSTAELSHISDFWKEAEVRRVSAAQVYNASYEINQSLRLVVMDNYHFWNVGNGGNASLMAVASKFGEKKLELPPELPISKANRAYLSDERFHRYALWDAVLCARVFKAFRARLQADYGVDVVQYPTSASLAMACYRQNFLPDTMAAPDPKVRRQAWHSLWGGRAEAYRVGDFEGEWILRDVTSLYPNSQRLIQALPGPDDWVERSEPQSWNGLCRVTFSFPESVKYPCLPVCHDGRLIFPWNGVSDCALSEVKVAIELGCTVEYLKIFEYDSGDISLSKFMDFFVAQKTRCEEKDSTGEMSDPVGRELSKLMMNSLIGKLSQNKGDVDIEDMKAFSKKIGVPLEVCISPTFYHLDKPKAKPRIGGHIMPEWSALILGKARALMAQLLNHVGESLICSTDSLLVPAKLDHLVDEKMLSLGIVLTNKNNGKKTHRVRVIRNRVYGAVDEKGETIFGATHAIHLGKRKKGCTECDLGTCKHPLHDGIRFIMSEETGYTKTKRLGLKTAIRKGEKFFSESETQMTFKRGWDMKRLLLAHGRTRPWVSIEEYDRVLLERKVQGIITIHQ